jgi:hypothetical protein
MAEWQPIETAPKDGTIFIAYDGRFQICAIVPADEKPLPSPRKWWSFGKPEVAVQPVKKQYYWVAACLSGERYGRMNIRPDYNWAPTHWLPLPAPPVEGT